MDYNVGGAGLFLFQLFFIFAPFGSFRSADDRVLALQGVDQFGDYFSLLFDSILKRFKRQSFFRHCVSPWGVLFVEGHRIPDRRNKCNTAPAAPL